MISGNTATTTSVAMTNATNPMTNATSLTFWIDRSPSVARCDKQAQRVEYS